MDDFSELFVTADRAGHAVLAAAARTTVEALAASVDAQPGPRSDRSPAQLRDAVAELDVCPAEGRPFDEVVADLVDRVWAHGVRTSHPGAAAHLHPPALASAVATELAIAATNQSLDSWDQSPAATSLELHLVDWLAATIGLPGGATGVLTSGGTASNLLGLTLARDRAGARGGHDVRADGLPAEGRSWRILCSDQAHFSVQRSAALLGLGQRTVVAVATDPAGRLDPVALDAALAGLAAQDLVPIAVVGTAGTTDLGAVDPLDAVADRAAATGAWFHVDAAVGGAFALSERLGPLLDGIGRADSVTVDLHKLWWQPIGASALLVADPGSFDLLRTPSDYLDRPEDDDDGFTNLVGRSLDTTRRFDAAKVVTSLRTVGRRRMAAMLDHLADLAQVAADEVRAIPGLELVADPTTVTCVFRWTDARDPDEVNRQVQLRLLARGEAVLGRTRRRGRTWLKLTFVNPTATAEDVRGLVRQVAAEAGRVASADPAANLAP